MSIPKCCGQNMELSKKIGTHNRYTCKKCGDSIFVKKVNQSKPVMLDD